MNIRTCTTRDLDALTALTIKTFRPYFEDTCRPMVGDVVFANQHGRWEDDYREMVPALHDPEHHKHAAVAESGGSIAGYVAWNLEPAGRHGEIHILAVDAGLRGSGLGRRLCEHALAHMKSLGVEVAQISTGGDPFHDPARRLYEGLGFTAVPVAAYVKAV